MSGKNMDILRQILAERFRDAARTTLYATVLEVNEEKRTCKVQIGDIEYEDVLLYAIENPELKGVVFIPVLNSRVLVTRVDGSDRLCLFMLSEIDKVIFTYHDVEVSTNEETINIKKGENISILIDADKLEVTNDKTKVVHQGDALTLTSDQATVKISTGGLTFKKGSSGIKKTLTELITALEQLTVTTGVGPSGFPINIAQFTKIKQELNTYLED